MTDHYARVLVADIMVPERNLIAVDNANLATCREMIEDALRMMRVLKSESDYDVEDYMIVATLKRALQMLIDTKAVGPPTG